jgi:hypothetical protein
MVIKFELFIYLYFFQWLRTFSILLLAQNDSLPFDLSSIVEPKLWDYIMNDHVIHITPTAP